MTHKDLRINIPFTECCNDIFFFEKCEIRFANEIFSFPKKRKDKGIFPSKTEMGFLLNKEHRIHVHTLLAVRNGCNLRKHPLKALRFLQKYIFRSEGQ